MIVDRKEIRDIRRQIKHNHGANKQRIDRAISSTNLSNKSKVHRVDEQQFDQMVNHEEEEDNEDECSFAPPNDQESMSKLQHYKTEANVNKNHFLQEMTVDLIGL